MGAVRSFCRDPAVGSDPKHDTGLSDTASLPVAMVQCDQAVQDFARKALE